MWAPELKFFYWKFRLWFKIPILQPPRIGLPIHLSRQRFTEWTHFMQWTRTNLRTKILLSKRLSSQWSAQLVGWLKIGKSMTSIWLKSLENSWLYLVSKNNKLVYMAKCVKFKSAYAIDPWWVCVRAMSQQKCECFETMRNQGQAVLSLSFLHTRKILHIQTHSRQVIIELMLSTLKGKLEGFYSELSNVHTDLLN